jgi:predicted restriction endonuclease
LSARNRGMSLDDLIVTLGYKRIHRNGESNKIIKSTVYYKNKSKELKEKISNQIKKHGKKSQIYEIRVRNRKFVEELKEMYDYECQICNNYEIPPIMRFII